MYPIALSLQCDFIAARENLYSSGTVVLAIGDFSHWGGPGWTIFPLRVYQFINCTLYNALVAFHCASVCNRNRCYCGGSLLARILILKLNTFAEHYKFLIFMAWKIMANLTLMISKVSRSSYPSTLPAWPLIGDGEAATRNLLSYGQSV